MNTDDKLMRVFLDVQRGLPRQGPGSRASTLKALGFCTNLPPRASVLDLGCGPGAQTMVLAEICSGPIVAVDTCEEYLDELRQRLRSAELTDRVEVRDEDMSSLDVAHESIDLIWCEAAAYNLGVSRALKSWRPLLKERGYLVFSELVWLVDRPADAVAKFWQHEYPAMTTISSIHKVIDAAGYDLVGDFTLPDTDWWTEYYSPLESKLPGLRQKYASDEQALGVVRATENEIDIRRRYESAYGYQFFIARVRAT